MPTFCRATFTYADASPERGSLLEGASQVELEVFDGRAEPLPGWETCGFELVEHASEVQHWTDDEELADVHYGEIEALARELTGCRFALVSDHVKRSGADEKRPREQAPVRLVHSDFAADYADVIRGAYHGVKGRGAATLARAGVTADDVEQAERIAMMQFWRNVGEPTMDLPVAWCDARSVTPSDVRPFHYTGYVAGGRSFDALALIAPDTPSRHRWYAFPDMHAGEVVAFRTYDTDLVAAGRTWFTPHSAFRDPRVEPGCPPRFSVELRVMCVF